MGSAAVIKILVILLFNFAIIALLTLGFFVFKSLFKLYIAKRNKVVGYKFRTKIVALFVTITLIPSVLLFIMSSGVLSAYIDKWFSPNIKVPIENAMFIAQTFYEKEKEKVLTEGKRFLKGLPISKEFKIRWLKAPSEQDSETIKAAFNGVEGVEVITSSDGDIIRAAIPVKKADKVRSVLIVEEILPKQFVIHAEQIREDYENFISLYKWRIPLKINYILVMGFFTLLIVFVALWVSLKISNWISVPIQKLALATEQVARGDLNVRVDIVRDDEIGMLVNSFNNMIRELKEIKESLENAYLESDRRRVCFENIVENIDSGVVSVNEEGKIITINSTAAKILNVTPEEIIDQDYEVLFKYIESDELREYVKGIRLDSFLSSSKQFRVSIGGQQKILKVFISHLRDSKGKSLGLLVVFEDITELLKAQQALAWQEVAKRMAHEIKNPLTPIKLSAERILKKWKGRDDNFGKVVENATRTIIKEVEQLQQMVNEFSKLGRMPQVRRTQTNVKQIIDELKQIYKGFEERISFAVDNSLPAAMIDREQLKRALMNLIDNAITATSDGGSIEVKVDYNKTDQVIEFRVSDTGVGIREEDRDKLFLPYFSTKKEGTGLGLAIVHKIVADHKGTIAVEDNKPKGAVFIIKIPVNSKEA
ncbi:MAG: HAMP domain-containing protein [Nitrospirae bacterium]|nr:HAMP domain-containing protein [Nitrospirota bacterium]